MKKRRENLNFENLNFGANFDDEPDYDRSRHDARNFEEREASTERTLRCPCTRSEIERNDLNDMFNLLFKLNHNNLSMVSHVYKHHMATRTFLKGLHWFGVLVGQSM